MLPFLEVSWLKRARCVEHPFQDPLRSSGHAPALRCSWGHVAVWFRKASSPGEHPIGLVFENPEIKWVISFENYLFKKRKKIYVFIYLLIERGEGREKEEKTHQPVASCTHPNLGPNRNPGMCPDQNRVGDLLLCGRTPNQLSHTDRGKNCFLMLLPKNKIVIRPCTPHAGFK